MGTQGCGGTRPCYHQGGPILLIVGVHYESLKRAEVKLSQWLNLLIDVGFRLERLSEPRPSDETIRECPALQDAQVVPYFLHVRARNLA